jgi:hypothetical protein
VQSPLIQSVPQPGADSSEFSTVLGGPLFQLYRRAHLSGDGLELAARRIIVVPLIAWLPLFILSLIEGTATQGVREPFLYDPDVQIRLLVALPLLVGAELLVHRRMRIVTREFLNRGLMNDAARERFDAALSSGMRLRNSVLAELLLLAFVYVIGVGVAWPRLAALHIDTWHRVMVGTETHVTLAGWWYRLVSLPLFQFILFRWYFRLGIWAWFLVRVSVCGLQLTPTHPDRCGGLGFVGEFGYAWVPILFAQGALFAGVTAAGMFYEGRTLLSYAPALVTFVVIVLLIVLGPLAVFFPILTRTKRTGLREYGAVAQNYVRDFDRKWVHSGHAAKEPLLGSSDIQSLADLANSYQIIAGMRFIPITPDIALRLVLATVAPILPLVLTIIPARELIGLLLKGLF